MGPQPRTADEVIALLAARAHGVVTQRELLSAGISRKEIRVRLERGALIRVHRGVYRVGHCAPSMHATYMAAVKACGDTAALCRRAAAHLLLLFKGAPPPPEVIAKAERKIGGVETHRDRRLDPRDVTTYQGIPTTTVPRTVVDLAAELETDALGKAVHTASVLHRTTPAQIEAVLARRPNAKGARDLRRILHGDERITLSKLERRFLACLRKARLPLPETNRRTDGRFVDCRWPDHKLTVELDGYRYHATRHAWEQDRQREREAYARGDQFRRYTYDDVERATTMLTELRQLLPSK
jgi:very-short-patch-repair endonuclease